jgi:hypothetical protein
MTRRVEFSLQYWHKQAKYLYLINNKKHQKRRYGATHRISFFDVVLNLAGDDSIWINAQPNLRSRSQLKLKKQGSINLTAQISRQECI